MKGRTRCAPGGGSSPAADWTVRSGLDGSECSPRVWVAPSRSWARRGPDSRQEFRRCWVRLCRRLWCWVVGSARGLPARGTFWPGLPEPDSPRPALPRPALPCLPLAVAPLCVPGSKPRCPRARLTSTPTLGIGMAAVPFSAEASPVCTVRAPGVSPAACSVPPGLRPPPVWPCAQAGPAAAAASETPQGLVLPQSLHSTQVGHQRAAAQ